MVLQNIPVLVFSQLWSDAFALQRKMLSAHSLWNCSFVVRQERLLSLLQSQCKSCCLTYDSLEVSVWDRFHLQWYLPNSLKPWDKLVGQFTENFPCGFQRHNWRAAVRERPLSWFSYAQMQSQALQDLISICCQSLTCSWNGESDTTVCEDGWKDSHFTNNIKRHGKRCFLDKACTFQLMALIFSACITL